MNNRYAIPLSWRNAALSVLATLVLWGLPWLVWPWPAGAGASAGRPTPPMVRYVRSAEGIDGTAWSPVVFPLPTKEGFSKKASSPEPGQDMVSVLKPRVSEAAFLEMPPDRAETADMGLLTVQEAVAFRPQPSAGSGLRPAGSRDADALLIERDTALAERAFDAPALKRFQPAEASLPSLSVTAYVELDPQGRVQHVLLETPSGQTNADAVIVRALYMGTASPAPASAAGRVRVNYWKMPPVNGESRN